MNDERRYSLTVAIGGMTVVDAKRGQAYLLACDGHLPRLTVPYDLVNNRVEVGNGMERYREARGGPAFGIDVHGDGRPYLSVDLRNATVTFDESDGGEWTCQDDSTMLDLDLLTGGVGPTLALGSGDITAAVDFGGGVMSAVAPVGPEARTLWTQEGPKARKYDQPIAAAFLATKRFVAQTCVIEVVWGEEQSRLRIVLALSEGWTAECSVAAHCPLSVPLPEQAANADLVEIRDYAPLYPVGTPLKPPTNSGLKTYRNSPLCPPVTTKSAPRRPR